jgi:hypothetical protein
MPQFLAAPYPWPSRVMVKVLVLWFHEELANPPVRADDSPAQVKASRGDIVASG